MEKPGTFHVAVSVVIEKDGKILITKRSPDRDHAPNEWEAGITGRVDQGETLEEAAIRETKEETGLEIKLIIPFGTFHFFRGKEKVEHQGVNYWAKYISGEVHLDPREQVEYRWVIPQEAIPYITDPSVIEELHQFIKLKRRFREPNT